MIWVIEYIKEVENLCKKKDLNFDRVSSDCMDIDNDGNILRYEIRFVNLYLSLFLSVVRNEMMEWDNQKEEEKYFAVNCTYWYRNLFCFLI